MYMYMYVYMYVMGQVQNGFKKNEAEECQKRSAKSVQTISLCYSSAKCTLNVLLTFNKVEKTKLENFDLVYLLSSFPGITRKVMPVTFLLVLSLCELLLASYGLKTASKMLRVLSR